MPAQPSFAAPRDVPGWKTSPSVPFGGKGGSRKPPKVRPKLTKLEKKALKWAQKHPEGNAPRGNLTTLIASSAATVYCEDLRQNALAGFIGQLATPRNLEHVNHAAQVYLHQAAGVFYNTPTAGSLNLAGTVAITTTTNTATTWNVPMWTDWNANWTPVTTASATLDGYYPRIVAGNDWTRWQGQGHQADLCYNPNDQVQRARLREARYLQDEAQYQQRRMARAAADAEQRRQWEAQAPERAAQAARQAEEATRQAEARKTALKRSYELLFRHLTDDQKNMLESENRFLIEVKSGKIYEIRRGIHQNIYRLDDQGRPAEQLCCLPQGQVPEGDVMLAQMLHLMVNEEGFRKVANRWELRDMTGQQLDRRVPLTQGAVQVDRRAA